MIRNILIQILLLSQGWTLYEILRYAPEHNWIAYEEALKTNPVLAKMAISGVVYAIGDWIAQVSDCFLQLLLLSSLSSWSFWVGYFSNHMLMHCSVMKGSLFLSLTGCACSDQAL